MKNNIRAANNSLRKLRDSVIGLIVVNKHIELITALSTDDGESFADTIHITNYGMINRTFNFPVRGYKYRLFPDEKNMNQMMDEPREYFNLINDLNK